MSQNKNAFLAPRKVEEYAMAALGGLAAYQYKKRREERKLRREEHHSATHDKLTGLLNSRGLEEALARSEQPVAFLYVDGTNQKAVNDKLGHDRGDAAIIGTADVLRNSLRPGDIIARIGGDEFLAALTKEARPEKGGVVRAPIEVLEPVIARAAQETEAFLNANPDLGKAGFNIAIGSAISQEGVSVDALRQVAEANMYTAKGEQHESGGQYRGGQ